MCVVIANIIDVVRTNLLLTVKRQDKIPSKDSTED